MLERKLLCVDISDYDTRKAAIAAELLSAAENEGFFYVTGHGIPEDELQRHYDNARAFFALEDSAKNAKRGDTSNPHYVLGYFSEELAAGPIRQGLLCAHDNSRMAGLWPTTPACFKEDTVRFMRVLHGVVEKLMTCFALALELPEDYFLREMSPDDDDNGSALSFNFFPSVEGRTVEEGGLRISAHTDFEVLTLLFQSRPGLEICPGKEIDGAASAGAQLAERWTPADPLPGAITCNLGDALQYWTDGRLRSTFHRVRVPRDGEFKGERISLAYFGNARLTTPLQGPRKRYPPVTFLDLLAKRLEKIPLPMDPLTGIVKADAVMRYHAVVAGPEVCEAAGAPAAA